MNSVTEVHHIHRNFDRNPVVPGPACCDIDWESLILTHDVLAGQTVNADFCSTVCVRLCGQWEILKHARYSPDINPCEFDQFLKLKEPLRGHGFPYVSSVRRSVRSTVANISDQCLANGLQRFPDI
ncbi:hypothetical protein TNCV_69691 [Trichonephila clavipes]|nr:hypothetical protein TNCV_69691 [Trichonephila clavipes]